MRKIIYKSIIIVDFISELNIGGEWPCAQYICNYVNTQLYSAMIM